MRKIAQIIREARKDKGMTQRELGQKSGLPQSHISKIESGNIDIRLSSLNEIIQLLDLELMFVPRYLKPVIHAMIPGTKAINQRPAWQVDEKDV